MNLENKNVLITGGAKRIGRAIALELANGGCNVAIHFRNSRTQAFELASAIRELGRRACAVAGDLNDSGDWTTIVDESAETLGGVDILVNNASVFPPDPDHATGDHARASHWETTFRVNATAAIALCHLARPWLEKGEGGAIVNLTDVLANRPWSKRVAYCASKAALNAATIALARKFAPSVRVNAVAPGIALFPESYDAATRKRLVSRVPVGREGTPREVAKLVRVLCEDGDYISGQIIAIDGGRSLMW